MSAAFRPVFAMLLPSFKLAPQRVLSPGSPSEARQSILFRAREQSALPLNTLN